jgi:hypothetical protein
MKTKLFSFFRFDVYCFGKFCSTGCTQFTQYMYNTININPAYAGSRGALSVFALHRTNGWD